MNLDAAIRYAIINSGIAPMLSTWQGEPSVFTRRPVPADATPIMVVVSANISLTDDDFLSQGRPRVIKDVIVYGNQPDDYRAVEAIAFSLRDLFHRDRFSISVDGYSVVSIVASGPVEAPTSDENMVARRVTLNISLLQTED